MALRRLSCFSPFRVGVGWLSSVASTPQHIITITLVDKEGLRHTVKGVKGQILSDVLAEVWDGLGTSVFMSSALRMTSCAIHR